MSESLPTIAAPVHETSEAHKLAVLFKGITGFFVSINGLEDKKLKEMEAEFEVSPRMGLKHEERLLMAVPFRADRRIPAQGR